jgi:hypothetical protein
LAGTPEEKRPLGYRWEDNIKVNNLKKIILVSMYRINLA